MRTLLFGTLAALLSLAIVEGFARLVVPPRWYHKTHPDKDAILAPHPERGYGFHTSMSQRWRQRDGDFDFEVTLNANGQRSGPLAEARAADFRVLAIGDSYTFGIGVEAWDRFGDRLERLLAERLGPGRSVVVYNGGVPGYSATQIRQVAEELVPLLEPQVVVYGAYANSYWRVQTPYVLKGPTLVTSRVADYAVVTPEGDLVMTPFEPGWLRSLDVWLKRHLHVGAHALSVVNRLQHWPRVEGRHKDEASVRRDYAEAFREIAAIDRLARAHGAAFVLLAIHGQQADGSFVPLETLYRDILRDGAEAAGIPFVGTLDELERRAAGERLFRFEHDIHWTPAAHAVAAELLLAEIEREGLIGAVPPAADATADGAAER